MAATSLRYARQLRHQIRLEQEAARENEYRERNDMFAEDQRQRMLMEAEAAEAEEEKERQRKRELLDQSLRIAQWEWQWAKERKRNEDAAERAAQEQAERAARQHPEDEENEPWQVVTCRPSRLHTYDSVFNPTGPYPRMR